MNTAKKKMALEVVNDSKKPEITVEPLDKVITIRPGKFNRNDFDKMEAKVGRMLIDRFERFDLLIEFMQEVEEIEFNPDTVLKMDSAVRQAKYETALKVIKEFATVAQKFLYNRSRLDEGNDNPIMEKVMDKLKTLPEDKMKSLLEILSKI